MNSFFNVYTSKVLNRCSNNWAGMVVVRFNKLPFLFNLLKQTL